MIRLVLPRNNSTRSRPSIKARRPDLPGRNVVVLPCWQQYTGAAGFSKSGLPVRGIRIIVPAALFGAAVFLKIPVVLDSSVMSSILFKR